MPSPNPPASAQTDQPETQQKILRAARQEFIERGMDGARMQRIAERAGVNKALIHYYFRSKQLLYEAILKDIITKVWDTMRSRLKGLEGETDMRSVIRTMVSTYLMTLKNNPDFPPIILREFAGGGKHFPAIAGDLVVQFSDIPIRLLGVVGADVLSRRMRPMNPVHLIINIIGMSAATFFLQPVVTVMHRRVFHKEIVFDDAFYEDRIEAITTMACDGILIADK